MTDNAVSGNNFLRSIVKEDIASGRLSGELITRFPPEPNGFLHIGHAKSICLNFGLAQQFGGRCHLRFDDTNPAKEEQAYIDAIQEDIRWLGFEWSGPIRYASDYFDTLYEYALHLIREGNAYVCDLSADEAREYRGTLTEAGKNSPYRDRSVDENLALFAGMRNGDFDEGSRVLRAKIDMAAPNINLRDPIIYRIRKVSHHQTADKWCIYPTYDFTHGQSDALEGITSKRKLKMLVDEKVVDGLDDPRMPTIAGMRRRGFTPASLRHFCDMVGVARSEGVVDVAMLEHAIRDDLDKNAPRAMCVMDPLKIVITNYPEDKVEWLTAPGHPNRDDLGERSLPFSREVYIERDDFREEANKKFKRLVLGKKVRLRSAYVLLAESVVKDEAGNIVEVHCSYDAATHGADPEDGIKPKGVIHWVSASHGKQATVRLYDRLFTHEAPDRGGEEFLDHVNPASLTIVENCWIEPGLADAAPEASFQFERTGYFVADKVEHSSAAPVFNRTIALRDTWGKESDV